MDLDRYLSRIGYDGPRTSTLSTLQALHERHPEAIAFENLNPLVGWPVSLDEAALEQKMLGDGRGGWCFEHNWLFRRALEALGFRVRGYAARVLWGSPPDHVGPRSHMVLEVGIDGQRYLADVGWGGATMTAPLLLQTGIEQATPHEPFRLMPWRGQDDEYVMEARLGEWTPLYRFRRDEQLQPDYEVSSHWLCTHPSSFFRRELTVARPYPGGRFALRNTTWTHRRVGAESETRLLTSSAAIREVLERDFLIRVPSAPELDAALERVVATWARE
jgi:N-hydroxyarylamine O-acetyltransferase